jgi:acyl-CoA synthetase (AMP-forming)/AMP-acid ligase II
VSGGSPLPRTVGSLLDAQGESRGRHPYLICDDESLTYAEAADRSATLARGLMAAGLAFGSRVGLLFPNGPDFAVAALATARIGAIAVPLSTFSTPAELQVLLRGADIDAVLAVTTYRRHDYMEILSRAVPEFDVERVPPLFAATVPSLRTVAFEGPVATIPTAWSMESLRHAGTAMSAELLRASQRRVEPSDRLVIVHTSGSTAEPKGVIHAHGSLLDHLRILNGLRRYGSEEILFSNSPFFWVGGYAYSLLGTLEAGATLVCSNSSDAGDVLDLLERTRPTMVNGFAQSVAHLAEHSSFSVRDLTSITRGNLYPIMSETVRPVDPEPHHNMLGMTETGSVCLASEDESRQPESRRGSFGRPTADIEARVVEPDSGGDCPAGQTGELYLRGPALMEGYYGKERWQTFDPDGWFHTGDLFHVDHDGYYYFEGRAGDMIKTAGANVSPREVEAALMEETGLVAHVFGVDDPGRSQVVVAVVRVPAGAAVPDPGQLAARLRARLSAYKVPRRIVMIEDKDVPMMSSGKLDIRALKEVARER